MKKLLTAAIIAILIFPQSMLGAYAESASLSISAPENSLPGKNISAAVQLHCDEPLLSVQFEFCALGAERVTSADILCSGVIECKVTDADAQIIIISEDVLTDGDELAEISIKLPKDEGVYTLSIENAFGVNERYETIELGTSSAITIIESSETEQPEQRVQVQTSSQKTRTASVQTRASSQLSGTSSKRSLSARSSASSFSRGTASRKNGSSKSSSRSKSTDTCSDDEEIRSAETTDVPIIYPDRLTDNENSDNRKILIYGGALLLLITLAKLADPIIKKIAGNIAESEAKKDDDAF